MTVYKFISKIFISALEAVPILLMYVKILQKEHYLKEHRKRVYLFILIYSVFTAWAFISMPMGSHTIVIITFSIIVLSILTSTPLKFSSIGVLISFIYALVIELGCLAVFSICVGTNSINLLQDIGIDIIFAIILNFIRVLIIRLMNRHKISFLQLNSKDEEDTITSYWIFGMFIMLLSILSINIVISNKVNIVLYQVLLFLLFLFFIVIGMVDYRKRIELNKIKNKFELKKEYAKNLESIVDIIRREKHDFANHINTVYAMCVLDKPNTVDRIKDYLKKTTNNLESAYRFFDTGNDYIDGLVAMKSNFAFENNIYLDVEFETSLEIILADDNDLVGIISNILDNAFEAFNLETHEGKKIVSVYGYVEENSYFLSIANNGPMIDKETEEKLFKKGFSTKNSNKKDHGFGLFIVDKLMKKNDGKIEISSSPHETEFLLEFKLKKDCCEEVG